MKSNYPEIKKTKRTVRRVFLHHSATDNPKHDNVDFIRKVHVEQNGWSDIGYHYFITKDGIIHECRPLFRKPAAQKGHNTATIAICLSGVEEFTKKQKKSLIWLCNEINTLYEGLSFHGHSEVNNTLCPAYPYKSWLNLDNEGIIQKPSLTKRWWEKLFFKLGDWYERRIQNF